MFAPYAAAHLSPTGPGDARPTALQIIKDQEAEGKLVGRVALITGCSSGIGVETARAIYATGATVYVTARNLEKAKKALGDLLDTGRVHILDLDLDSFDSVRRCAAEFLSKEEKLHLLILNAGVMTPPEGRTKDGFELQIGSNHLSHFLLFNLLKPALLAGSEYQLASRVVILSSVGHRFGEPNLDDLNFEGKYDAHLAYAASKTANLWTANEIERKYGSEGIHAWAVHPGGIFTDLVRHVSEEQMAAMSSETSLVSTFKSPEQGAATTVLAAVARDLEGRGGKYLENCQFSEPHDPSTGMWGPGYAPHAYSPDKERDLWNKSLGLVGL
ncbi:uncharacterized protein BDZ83DRAFT_94543 [Colletotrichum acutatum]|uniref:Uncharacterized protein n=1 Tax=Glomerella acutata TaxID=27357 RepID=A0AAD8XCD6_GLOAC|nr:uncharacterized protein BDZ83DRAFT_94543 [Colletotrichum acutatum]KAK1712611.1 hypothetical protein BDZ83DRAFT_94543 [Colletotrichum acutatum]